MIGNSFNVVSSNTIVCCNSSQSPHVCHHMYILTTNYPYKYYEIKSMPRLFFQSAASGEEALDIIEECDFIFDLVIVDQTLSSDSDRLRGCDIAHQLQSNADKTLLIGLTDHKYDNEALLTLTGTKVVWEKPLKSEEYIINGLALMYLDASALGLSFPLFMKLFER